MSRDMRLKEIGMRVRNRRKDMNKTQEEMAELLNISLTHYKNIEHGRTAMSLDMLTDICDKMEIDPTFVLTGKETEENPIIRFYNSLPEEKKPAFNRAMYYLDRIYEE